MASTRGPAKTPSKTPSARPSRPAPPPPADDLDDDAVPDSDETFNAAEVAAHFNLDPRTITQMFRDPEDGRLVVVREETIGEGDSKQTIEKRTIAPWPA